LNFLVIGLNAYRESIRRKTLIAFLLFSMLLIGSSTFLTVLSPGEEIKMVKDVCLSAISFFGMLIAVFAAGSLIPAEMENRTIYTTLSKPMKRVTYLLGKYLGAQLTILLNITLMSALFLTILYLQSRRYVDEVQAPFSTVALVTSKAMLLIYFELLVLSALAFAISTLSTSVTLPVIGGIFIYIVGHSVDYLKNLSEHASSDLMGAIIRVFYLVLPNFSNFYIRNQLIHNDPYVPQGIWKLFLYALVSACLGLSLAYFLFRKKDL
jgi:ABC-type transport system involved in multi-copper enzyme maturation permease subunit